MATTLSSVFLQYRTLVAQPAWRLLNSLHAAAIAALLQTILNEKQTRVSQKSFLVALEEGMAEIDALEPGYFGATLTPGVLMKRLIDDALLSRTLPAGESEEVIELAPAGLVALKFIGGIQNPQSAATESRLNSLILMAEQLSKQTDSNRETRLQALYRERDALDAEIRSVQTGNFVALDNQRASERLREILRQAQELSYDFRQVKDEFSKISKVLIQRLSVDSAQSRHDTLEQVFKDVDVLEKTPPGKTFAALYSLLTDTNGSQLFAHLLEDLVNKDFARGLSGLDREFLASLINKLMIQGLEVKRVQQGLSRNLRRYVSSKKSQENPRILENLQRINQSLMSLTDKPTSLIGYRLAGTQADLSSVTQLRLTDKKSSFSVAPMKAVSAEHVDLDDLVRRFEVAEVDMRSLAKNIRDVLKTQSAVSIQQLMELYPPKQGLGTLMGYLHLAKQNKATFLPDTKVRLHWSTYLRLADGAYERLEQSSDVPVFFFHQDLHSNVSHTREK